jgi:cytochrome bd-type quinol oxidase subunit 2
MISRYSDNKIDWEETLNNAMRVALIIVVLVIAYKIFTYPFH